MLSNFVFSNCLKFKAITNNWKDDGCIKCVSRKLAFASADKEEKRASKNT